MRSESAGGGELNTAHAAHHSAVVIDVDAPAEFSGQIFAGLFTKPCPLGRPVACAVTRGAGTVTLRGVPDGLFYLCVAGVTDPLLLADGDRMLRAGGARNPILVRDGIVSGPTSVRLRPREATDPPILVALPFIGRRSPARRAAPATHFASALAAGRSEARRTSC